MKFMKAKRMSQIKTSPSLIGISLSPDMVSNGKATKTNVHMKAVDPITIPHSMNVNRSVQESFRAQSVHMRELTWIMPTAHLLLCFRYPANVSGPRPHYTDTGT